MRGMPVANVSTLGLVLTLVAGCTPQDPQRPRTEPPGDASRPASADSHAEPAAAARDDQGGPVSIARGREVYARQCADLYRASTLSRREAAALPG